MRNLLAFVAAAVLVFAGLGWYLDWYSLKPVPGSAPGRQSYNIDINRDKIARDVEKGVQTGEAKLQGVLDKKAAEEATKAVEKVGTASGLSVDEGHQTIPESNPGSKNAAPQR